MLIFIRFINTSPAVVDQLFIKIGSLKNFAILMLTVFRNLLGFPSQNAGIVILCHRSVFIFKERVYPSGHFSMFCKNKLLEKTLDISQPKQYIILSSLRIVFNQKNPGIKKYDSNYS